MIRQKIGFKNARALYFESNLEDYYTHYEDASFLAQKSAELIKKNIKHIYFLTSGSSADQTEIKAKIESSFNQSSIKTTEFAFKELESNNFSDLLEQCQKIQFLVKESSCLFLYSATKSKQLDLFAAMFMLTLKSMRSIEPEYAIEYITGEKNHAEDLKLVYDFKKYLNPGYEKPNTDKNPETDPQEILATTVNDSDEEFITEEPTILVESEKSEAKPSNNQEKLASNSTEDNINTSETNEQKGTNAPPALTEVKDVNSVVTSSSNEILPSSTNSTPVAVKPTKTPAKITGTPKVAQGSFKKSKFSIKVKLLSIISGIIVLALVGMATIASGFFSRATETSIQSNNLNLAETIAGRVEKELSNISYKAHLMALSLDKRIGTASQRQLYIDLFLKNNKDYLFLGVGEKSGNGFRFRHTLYNKTIINNLGITKATLNELSNTYYKSFSTTLNGAFVVQNVSEGLPTPILGVSLPLRPGTVVILFMDPGQFLKSFKTRGVTAFMVNNKGDVIAHQDSKMVLTNTNLARLGIVKNMLESPSNNGLTQYEDEDGVGFLGSYKKLTVGGLGIITTIAEEKAFAAVSRIRITNLIITVVFVCIAFILIYFFAKSLSEPIKELAEATQKIEKGEFDIDITPVTRDEVGFLTHSFGHMAEGLAERERAKDALGRFVNKQVAELALSGNINLGGETKEAAVFFSDLRGFTAMSEKMTPAEVVSYLNEYFTGMVDAVLDTHGIVDKFIGDAVMAHWGAFGSTGNNTENAINGGLLMRTAIMEFNKRGAGKRPFAKQGCGINTGAVVSGQIGSEARFEFTVIGDTVNLAARIEALNKPFGTDILISQDSYDLVPNMYKVEAMPAITVKGKSEPLVIYAVVGRLDDPNCPKDLDEVRDMLGIVFDKTKEIDVDAKEEKFEVVGE